MRNRCSSHWTHLGEVSGRKNCLTLHRQTEKKSHNRLRPVPAEQMMPRLLRVTHRLHRWNQTTQSARKRRQRFQRVRQPRAKMRLLSHRQRGRSPRWRRKPRRRRLKLHSRASRPQRPRRAFPSQPQPRPPRPPPARQLLRRNGTTPAGRANSSLENRPSTQRTTRYHPSHPFIKTH